MLMNSLRNLLNQPAALPSLSAKGLKKFLTLSEGKDYFSLGHHLTTIIFSILSSTPLAKDLASISWDAASEVTDLSYMNPFDNKTDPTLIKLSIMITKAFQKAFSMTISRSTGIALEIYLALLLSARAIEQNDYRKGFLIAAFVLSKLMIYLSCPQISLFLSLASCLITLSIQLTNMHQDIKKENYLLAVLALFPFAQKAGSVLHPLLALDLSGLPPLSL